MALKNLNSTLIDNRGFFWDSKSAANKALTIAKQATRNALKQQDPQPKVETVGIPWVKVSECPPPVSDAMVIRKVLVWHEGEARFGRFIGGALNEWRLEGCNFKVDIEYYAIITKPVD
jgi:hypothetical protein